MQALLALLGNEVAVALTDAAERVTALATTGRISRAGLRVLRDEIDRARRAVLKGQQVARLASGRVRVSPERLDLTALLHESVRSRAREIHARGIELRQQLAPTEVRTDATLLPGLLAAVLDWSFERVHRDRPQADRSRLAWAGTTAGRLRLPRGRRTGDGRRAAGR